MHYVDEGFGRGDLVRSWQSDLVVHVSAPDQGLECGVSLWAKRDRLTGKPVQVLWGLKDPAFKMRELDRWKTAFPNLEAQTFSNVGHFVAEELGPDAIGPVQAFLRTHP